MIREAANYAYANVKTQRMRSFLTMLGVIIGVAAIIALVSLSQGLENAIVEQFAKMGINSIRIAPAHLNGPPAGDRGFNVSDAQFVASVKSVDYVNQLLMQFSSVKYQGEEEFMMISGYDTELSGKGFLDADIKIGEGRFFVSGEKGAVILGDNVARDLFRKDIFVGNNIEIQGKKFKVIAIFENTGTPVDDNVYIPIDVARELFNKTDFVNAMVVKLKPGFSQDEVVADLERKLERRLGEGNFDIFTPDQILRQLNTILGIVQAVLGGIAAIALLVGGIGIMNSMFTAVLERTREIGVMKAVGARNSDILNVFLVESGIIGLTGGAIGVAIGFGIAKSIELVARIMGFSLLSVRLDPVLVVGALLFSFIIGMVSGALPAYRAARLKPVDALRYE